MYARVLHSQAAVRQYLHACDVLHELDVQAIRRAALSVMDISWRREEFTLLGRCAPKGALDGPGIDGTDKLEQPSKKGKPLPPGKATVGKI